MRASALDAVLKDAHRLKLRVGKADGHRIDAHLESLFQLQHLGLLKTLVSVG